MNTITFDNDTMIYNTDRNTCEDILSAAFLAGKEIRSSWYGSKKAYYIHEKGGELAFIIVII